MRLVKASLVSLGLVAAFTSTAAAQHIQFDNVTTSPFAWIQNGYAGLDWNNAFVINPTAWYGSPAAAGGFNTAMQSTSYVMSNGGAAPMSISSTNSFNLLGGVFAAAWTNGLTVNAKGYANGVQLYSKSFTVDWTQAQYVALDMAGVDNVMFSNSGGTVDPMYPWDSSHAFVIDNLELGVNGKVVGTAVNVVPEPMTMSLVGFGLLALGGANARRRRQVATA